MSKRASDDLDYVRHHIKREGAKVAYHALLDVAGNKQAPAPARATAGVAIMRAAGLFEAGASAKEDKEPYEMTADELAEAIARLNSERNSIENDGDEPGLFD